MAERRRTVLLFQAVGLEVDRQERVLLEYVREHRYEVSALTASPGAAVALVRDHLADVVLVCFSTPGTDEMADVVHDFGGVLEAVRRTRRPGGPTVDERNTRMIRQAADRGAGPETIAQVLGLPLRQVLDVLADRIVVADAARDMYTRPVERRPLRSEDLRAAERSVSPRERRPQPLREAPVDEHPWRTDNRAAFPNRPPDDPQARTRPVERPSRATRPEALDESTRTQRIHRVPRPADEASAVNAERPSRRRPRPVGSR